MKANELMVGDWVYNTHNRQNERVQEVGSGLMMLANNDLYEYDEIEPIPLVQEILERNGFDNVIWQGEASWSYHENEVYVCISGRSGGIKHFGYNGWDSKIAISSVHELQHALKLCGINHEIIL